MENFSFYQNSDQVLTITEISSQSVNAHNLITTQKSPQLSWQKIEKAASYVIMMIDYEASSVIGVPFIHWLAANIKTNSVSEGQIENLILGRNSAQNTNQTGAYMPPAPPDANHNYTFRVFALSETLNLESGFQLNQLFSLMANKVLAEGETTFVGRQASTPGNAPVQKVPFHGPEKLSRIKIASSSVVNGFLKEEFINSQKQLELSWTKVAKAKSYALMMINYQTQDLVKAPFIHFVVANLKTNHLSSGWEKQIGYKILNNSQTRQILFANNDFVAKQYLLAPDQDHQAAAQYLAPFLKKRADIFAIRIYALDQVLPLAKSHHNWAHLHSLMHGHIVGLGAFYFKALT